MAVFTASINKKEDAKNAILIDVKMTHPDKLVQEAITIYQFAIHYLLNNQSLDHFKGQQAFEQALKDSQSMKTYQDEEGNNQSVHIWLKLAQRLNDLTSRDDQ